MLQIIECNCCNKSGLFDLHLEFTRYSKSCECCRHLTQYHWKYWFCDLTCMFKWLKDNNVEAEGFPCQDCCNYETNEPTGWFAGFESNGTCSTCKGNKKIKSKVE